MIRPQVLVVGGGPAGSSAAWHCAMAGLDVCLVDRARFPRAKPCAEYVSPEGSRLLHAMGALETLEAQAAHLTGMVVHAPSGERIHGEFVARHGFRGFRDKGLGVRREILDTVLLRRARDAGVTVIEEAKVESLTHDDVGAVNGAVVRTEEGTQVMRASLVIGADGLRSVVSRRLRLAHHSRWPRRVALVAHYRDVQGIGSLGEMHVTRTGYVGLAQVSGGLVNVALVVPKSRAGAMRDGAAAYLDAWIAAQPSLAPRFAGATRVTPVRATGPFASRASRPWAPGAMLTGDAADFYDPFTGEGIYSGLRGGELLAEYAQAAVLASSRDAHLRALRGYGQARKDVFGGKWRVEQLIGLAVSVPPLLNHAARVLSRDRDLADLLIGVTGDFVPPSAVLRPRTLLRFFS
ncbi:NAD(P)/FAD-dependent oxidoreductase [Gemmatimonas sp.]|uniref:NAD(P)/FAD-dependent oxidoreductase n=1 Tax=Gemmatimonas sp. TaxID=1962908 RepID=UPI0037BFA33C